MKRHVFEIEVVDEKINPPSYYGIPVCGTWNGAICLEELQAQIAEAKELYSSSCQRIFLVPLTVIELRPHGSLVPEECC